jgi:hypothetical protein
MRREAKLNSIFLLILFVIGPLVLVLLFPWIKEYLPIRPY